MGIESILTTWQFAFVFLRENARGSITNSSKEYDKLMRYKKYVESNESIASYVQSVIHSVI